MNITKYLYGTGCNSMISGEYLKFMLFFYGVDSG